MSLCASVHMCLVVTCWERADLLALVCGVYCEFVTFPLVSWVRCGTWLYRFLIFAPLLTFIIWKLQTCGPLNIQWTSLSPLNQYMWEDPLVLNCKPGIIELFTIASAMVIYVSTLPWIPTCFWKRNVVKISTPLSRNPNFSLEQIQIFLAWRNQTPQRGVLSVLLPIRMYFKNVPKSNKCVI